MNVSEMSKQDFEKVPFNEGPFEPFDVLVIIPTDKMHDSGFQCMQFVATNWKMEPLYRFGGSADVIHIDGFLGIGRWEYAKVIPSQVEPKNWSIDMLPCGYIRVFCRGYKLSPQDGWIGSDLELYADRKCSM